MKPNNHYGGGGTSIVKYPITPSKALKKLKGDNKRRLLKYLKTVEIMEAKMMDKEKEEDITT